MKNIELTGVKQNNLQNIDVQVPLGSFTVVCGPSGSGKSSLAFETLFAEGQRRFIESMSTYARQFLNAAPKPDLETITNIPPTISIEQKNSVKNSRSTVGTTSEILDYLRLLYEKLGTAFCPTHHIPTVKESPGEATDRVLSQWPGQRGYILTDISEKHRVLQGKELHALLLKEGFLRILVKGQMLEINGPAAIKKGLPKKSFYLVIDRLQFDPDERGRITDSMEQAYEASQKFNNDREYKSATLINVTGEELHFSEIQSCPKCDYQPPQLSTKFFSFNSPVGACPTCKGFGNTLEIDEKKVVPNSKLSIKEGALNPFTMPSATQDKKALLDYCKKVQIPIDISWAELSQEHRDLIWNGSKEFFGVKGLFRYLEDMKYKMHVRVFISRYRSPSLCPNCQGARLRPEVTSVYFKGRHLHQLCEMTLGDLQIFFKEVHLTTYEAEASGEVFRQILDRLSYLNRVGVSYLTLARETRTLSGGEYQRLLLAQQLGMQLSQTLYVLDEPTVGLHPRDNQRLISILKDIEGLGNTLVVVEHDHEVIRNADYIIEMGPGSGYLGGHVVFQGVTSEFMKYPKSNTAPYLKRDNKLPEVAASRLVDRKSYKYLLSMQGAKGQNLKNIDVDIPLHRLVVVTGVSGSGKSTLITKTLYPAVARALDIEYLPCNAFDTLTGTEHLNNVVLLDQSSIGKSARSNPMTYLKAYDGIRNLMAGTSEAKALGFNAGTFSLNVDGGRCPSCKGTGVEEIDMMFMDDVILPCEVCDGKKFRSEVLEVKYKAKNITEILNLTVEEAMDFFIDSPSIRKSLAFLREVGLDYLRLGQRASSLSGGESQRLKMARELTQVSQKATLYILDEPTTGLHFREVDMLIKVLRRLIDSGASVVVVEHNLDIVRNADYIIDLGPDAGMAGGEIVAKGTPTEIKACLTSLTGKYL